ncbi:stress responsive a/B barrel domain-containing protein [Ditylenchus destructor]|nr:stress responsive a/B barrel domain-containing protein [Ditylenchus destructor]
MIRHIVLVKFKAELDSASIEAALNAVVALKDKIEGIIAVSVGDNNSPENLEKGFRHGFVVDFVDSAARDAYLPHPEHAKVGKSAGRSRRRRPQWILVFDYTF